MKNFIFFALLVLFTSTSFSQNFIFDGKDNHYYSLIDDAKIVFLEDKIKFIKNDNEYEISFLNQVDKKREINKDYSYNINYYNDKNKIENLKVFTKIMYGDIEVSVSDKIQVKNIKEDEIIVEKKHINKLTTPFYLMMILLRFQILNSTTNLSFLR